MAAAAALASVVPSWVLVPVLAALVLVSLLARVLVMVLQAPLLLLLLLLALVRVGVPSPPAGGDAGGGPLGDGGGGRYLLEATLHAESMAKSHDQIHAPKDTPLPHCSVC